jgi:hypothetical protein
MMIPDALFFLFGWHLVFSMLDGKLLLSISEYLEDMVEFLLWVGTQTSILVDLEDVVRTRLLSFEVIASSA